MGDQHDPDDANVTDATRSFEETDDEQVTSGPDRAPTPEEEAAAERAEPLTDENREAYQDMVERGADVRGEGQI